MKLKQLALLVLFAAAAASCGTSKKIVYFQDLEAGESSAVSTGTVITIRPEDRLSIIVNCPTSPEISNWFNLPYTAARLGDYSSSSNFAQGVSGYTVDAAGNIDFPLLGSIHVEGMRREDVASHIKNEILSRGYANDIVVTVDYMNFYVSVFGEVNNPGQVTITRDSFTIFDAIASAGDLTIQGKRDGVVVLRNENGQEKKYVLDLCSASDVTSSPAFYLRQNDRVYVEPNAMRTRQSTVNGNNVLSAPFWISVASLISTVSLHFINR